MKIALVVALVLATAYAVPRPKQSLFFRNLYKDVLPGAKPKSPIDGRIINGKIAEPHQIPFQAFLTVYSKTGGWYCGGSLISENYILTAGHCGEDGEEADIVLGAQAARESEPDQVHVTSTKIVVHPGFNMAKILNDIAVMGLSKPVKLNSAVNTIALPTRANAGKTYEGVTARVSGWGLTNGEINELSRYLRYVDSRIISNAECKLIFGIVEEYEVCISGEGGKGSCSGDSGGPLVADDTVIGVVSYGAKGCPSGYPSAFTRTGSFLDFIEQNTDVKIV